MEAILDRLWEIILGICRILQDFLDTVFSPLNSLGPAVAIFVIALLTVGLTKLLTRYIQTKRYRELKEQFRYWYNMRQEALKTPDGEKAKRLARNIDQANLNKVYYDYFFEGLLLRLATKYLPILLALAYVNEAYRPAVLQQRFGKGYVFKLPAFTEEPVVVGAAFWFVVSVVLVYLGWFWVRRQVARTSVGEEDTETVDYRSDPDIRNRSN